MMSVPLSSSEPTTVTPFNVPLDTVRCCGPVALTVPLRIMPPLDRFHEPVVASRTIPTAVLLSVPVTFTVPPLRVKWAADITPVVASKPALVGENVPPRLRVVEAPPLTLIRPALLQEVLTPSVRVPPFLASQTPAARLGPAA